MSKLLGSFKFIVLTTMLMIIQAAIAESTVHEALYGYLTKYKGEVFASSNWYINASPISEKIGTVLLEDFQDSKFELDGNKLILNLKTEGVRVEVATIDESIIASLVEGERALVQTKENLSLQLVAQKARPTFTMGWGCGITGCSFNPKAGIKRSYLFELILADGQLICVNQGYQSEWPKFYSGKCVQ